MCITKTFIYKSVGYKWFGMLDCLESVYPTTFTSIYISREVLSKNFMCNIEDNTRYIWTHLKEEDISKISEKLIYDIDSQLTDSGIELCNLSQDTIKTVAYWIRIYLYKQLINYYNIEYDFWENDIKSLSIMTNNKLDSNKYWVSPVVDDIQNENFMDKFLDMKLKDKIYSRNTKNEKQIRVLRTKYTNIIKQIINKDDHIYGYLVQECLKYLNM